MPPNQSKRTRRTVRPGDVVTVDFPGATGIKRRPAVVISTDAYHAVRPDIILGLLTSQIADAGAPTDYALKDWPEAGLHHPSAFRAFVVTMPKTSIRVVGHLSDRDWQEIQTRLNQALSIG